jgi:hypothetical protein
LLTFLSLIVYTTGMPNVEKGGAPRKENRKRQKPEEDVFLRKPNEKKPGSSPVGGTVSDVTLKNNISYFGSGILSKIIALKPVRWNWKDKEEGTEIQYGFIAQDVERVIPHLVSEGIWKDGSKKKLLNTTDMIPYLVSAIKEQQDQIVALQRLVSKLQPKKKSSKSKAN